MHSARSGRLVYAGGWGGEQGPYSIPYSLSFFLLFWCLDGKHVDPVPMGYEELKTHPHERLPLTLEEVSLRRNQRNEPHP